MPVFTKKKAQGSHWIATEGFHVPLESGRIKELCKGNSLFYLYGWTGGCVAAKIILYFRGRPVCVGPRTCPYSWQKSFGLIPVCQWSHPKLNGLPEHSVYLLCVWSSCLSQSGRPQFPPAGSRMKADALLLLLICFSLLSPHRPHPV